MWPSTLFQVIALVFISASHAFDNSCLYKRNILNRYGPKKFNCPKFVIDSTDEIWNSNRTESYVYEKLEKYMPEDWQSVTNFGEYIQGMDKLKTLVMQTFKAFPDIKLHMVDTFCEGNDNDGYKTTMPVIHTATHLGWHPIFGKPTGRKLVWSGIPNCFIKNIGGQWKYTAEWNLPDVWSLYTQLGVNPPHPHDNPQPIDDCEQIFDWKTGYLNPKLIPKSGDDYNLNVRDNDVEV